MNVATGGGPSQTNPSSAPPASIPSGAVTERRRRTLIRVTVLAFACAKRVVDSGAASFRSRSSRS